MILHSSIIDRKKDPLTDFEFLNIPSIRVLFAGCMA